jgi:hypothetical protein
MIELIRDLNGRCLDLCHEEVKVIGVYAEVVDDLGDLLHGLGVDAEQHPRDAACAHTI